MHKLYFLFLSEKKPMSCKIIEGLILLLFILFCFIFKIFFSLSIVLLILKFIFKDFNISIPLFVPNTLLIFYEFY